MVCTACIVYTAYMTGTTTGSADIIATEEDDGGDGRLNFADEFRPDTFAKVFGQESVVACLFGLIARGRIARCILLHGSVGSGKTTLARIYARALNCTAGDPRSSPCYACPNCGSSHDDPIPGFEEYNISRYGGGDEAVDEALKAFYGRPKKARYRILFFDEAHTLTKDACDLLLNHVEMRTSDVVFLFATTEAERVREALRSRLFDLIVRPLAITEAIEFLRRAAEGKKIEHEPGALALLAGLRKGYPRDLLLGLERVWNPNDPRLTVEQVREAFDVDQTKVLVDYFTALADCAPDPGRDGAAEIALRWREAAGDKIRWIQAFLVHVYHNEILGRRLLVDGVIEAIPADVRAGIVRRFCARLGLTDPGDLAPYWRQLMEFWPMPETAVDETALGLRLALFHQLVEAPPVDELGGAIERAQRTGHTAARTSTGTATMFEPPRGFGPPPALRPGGRLVKDQDGFLTQGDVRRIVHAASFLMQEHGVLFNAAFTVRPAVLGAPGVDAAVAAIGEFRDDLAAQARVWDGEVIAGITLLERDEGGVVGRMVVHLRVPNPLGPADADGADRIATWARAWRDGAGCLGGDAVKFVPAPEGDRASLRFHWRKTLDLCAGLDPSVETWDPALGEHRPLIKLLRVRPRSIGPVLDYPLVEIPAPLSDEAIAEACRDRLEPLSAFDDDAWGELTTGWELEEFDERRRTRVERARRLAEVGQRFGEGTSKARAEVERIVNAWSSDPQRRRRRWRGWRAGRPWP